MKKKTYKSIVSTKNLYSLSLRDGISGSFFLGSETVKNNPEYYYFEKQNGFYALKHVSTDNSLIKITSEQPKVKTIKVVTKYQWNEIMSFIFDPIYWLENFLSYGLVDTDAELNSNEQYIFYVPQNSILQSYKTS